VSNFLPAGVTAAQVLQHLYWAQCPPSCTATRNNGNTCSCGLKAAIAALEEQEGVNS